MVDAAQRFGLRIGALNLDGREPNGKIRSGHKRDVVEWLAERLLELVNVDSGEPAVAAVHFTDDHYERRDGDPLGDLLVEWNRNAPIDTVWSPATGVVTAPYLQWRTGDHHREGLLLASGPGIEARAATGRDLDHGCRADAGRVARCGVAGDRRHRPRRSAADRHVA